jgi:hypothetical protein
VNIQYVANPFFTISLASLVTRFIHCKWLPIKIIADADIDVDTTYKKIFFLVFRQIFFALENVSLEMFQFNNNDILWCVSVMCKLSRLGENKRSRDRSQYGDWLRAGRLRGRSSRPGRGKNFLFSTSSRPSVRSTHSPIQWVLGDLFQGWSGRGVNWRLTSK